MLRRIIFLFLFAATLQAQVPLGASKTEVVSILGWPAGGSKFGDREVMNYSDYSILLIDGKVASVEAKPNRKAKAKVPGLVAPRPASTAPTGPSRSAAPAPIVQGKPGQAGSVVRPASQQTSVNDPAVISSPRPPAAAAPPVDIFAPLRRVLYVFVAVFVLAAGVVMWRIAVLKKRQAGRALDEVGTWVSTTGGERNPPLIQGFGREKLSIPPRPDPLKDGWSLALLKSLEWHRIEQLVAEYYRRLGYRANLTSFGADGGVDVEVFRAAETEACLLIQCKAWTGGMVGVAPVRELYGVAAARKVAGTVFFATSGFYPDAVSFADSVGMELIDGEEFLARIKRLPLSGQLSLHEFATAGDYRTPTCAKCGTKMVLRTATKGSNAGGEFYSCRSYPRCRNTINVPRAG